MPRLVDYAGLREDELGSVTTGILDALDVREPGVDAASTLVALVEGLTLSVCLGRIGVDPALALADAHLTMLLRDRSG
jgi:hypothetical protein